MLHPLPLTSAAMNFPHCPDTSPLRPESTTSTQFSIATGRQPQKKLSLFRFVVSFMDTIISWDLEFQAKTKRY